MEIMSGLIKWCASDPVRLAILLIVLLSAIIILVYTAKMDKIKDSIIEEFEDLKNHLKTFETSAEKRAKEVNTSMKDLDATAIALKMKLEEHQSTFKLDKAEITRAIVDAKLETRQATDLFRKAITKFIEVKKETDANMGRILEVDAKLGVLVEKNKEKK